MLNKRWSMYGFILVAVCLAVTTAGAQVNLQKTRAAVMPADQEVRSVLELLDFAHLEFDASKIQVGDTFKVEVELDGKIRELNLWPHSLRSDDFVLQVSDDQGVLHQTEPPMPCTYRGNVSGVEGSAIAASLIKGQFYAMVFLGPKDSAAYFIQPLPEEAFPLAPRSAHVVYLSEDSYAAGTFTDKDIPNPERDDAVMARPRVTAGFNGGLTLGPPAGTFYRTQLAFDNDYEFYTKNGYSVDNTVADDEYVMNGVSLIYERDADVCYEIVHVIVRTSEPDPYTTTNPDTLLGQLRSHWKNNQAGVSRDLVHMMTGKNLDGTTIGIGYVDCICSYNYGYALSQSRFSSAFKQRSALTAHEMGHNYGCAGHCDAFANCNIMCSVMGGCDGLGLPNFQTWAINHITSTSDSSACLDTVTAYGRLNVSATAGDVMMQVSPPDLDGLGSQIAPFDRRYNVGTQVTITSETEKWISFLLYRFQQWELDGVPQPGNETLQFTMGESYTEAVATFAFAAKVNVNSTPVSGVDIAVSPTDLDSQTTIHTSGVGTWWVQELVTFEAPMSVGGLDFQYWKVGGQAQAPGQNQIQISIPNYGTTELEAVYYESPWTPVRGKGHAVPGGLDGNVDHNP